MSQKLPRPELHGDTDSPDFDHAKRAAKESTHLTLADLMVANVGVAIVLATPASFGPGLPVPYGIPGPPWKAVLFWMLLFGLALLHGVSVAIFARCVRYQRMPFAAEWMLLIVSCYSLSHSVANVDTTLHQFWRQTGIQADSFSLWRLGAGVLATVSALVACYLAERKWLSVAARILLYLFALTAVFWGPCTVLPLMRSELFPPRFTWPLPVQSVWRGTIKVLLRLPFCLLIWLTLRQALQSGTPWSNRRWSECLGLVIGATVLLGACVLLCMDFAASVLWRAF